MRPQSEYRSLGSQSGPVNRVHKVDLVSEDNASLQLQIEEKLHRIQKIFEGQNSRTAGSKSATDTATLTEKTPRGEPATEPVRDALRA